MVSALLLSNSGRKDHHAFTAWPLRTVSPTAYHLVQVTVCVTINTGKLCIMGNEQNAGNNLQEPMGLMEAEREVVEMLLCEAGGQLRVLTDLPWLSFLQLRARSRCVKLWQLAANKSWNLLLPVWSFLGLQMFFPCTWPFVFRNISL